LPAARCNSNGINYYGKGDLDEYMNMDIICYKGGTKIAYLWNKTWGFDLGV
jgi:hypothetical protein